MDVCYSFEFDTAVEDEEQQETGNTIRIGSLFGEEDLDSDFIMPLDDDEENSFGLVILADDEDDESEQPRQICMPLILPPQN